MREAAGLGGSDPPWFLGAQDPPGHPPFAAFLSHVYHTGRLLLRITDITARIQELFSAL